jgi:hypothetical protein
VSAWPSRAAGAAFFGFLAVFAASAARAGPPFVTDDPVPTDYRSWEIYAGAQYEKPGARTAMASLPFLELNYGALPNVQVSLTLSFEEDASPGGQRDEYGGTEVGIKTRFVQESADRPQISFYPSVQTPAENGEHAVTFLPVWLQKSFGPWSSFGGGGEYVHPGPGNRNYAFFGGALERSVSRVTDIGAEVYHQGAQTSGGSDLTAARVGVISQIGKYHAVVFSVGRAFHGDETMSAYASYEFVLGPSATK